MKYLGDFVEDGAVDIYFTTNDGSGGAVAPSTAFEEADFAIYKDGSATQKPTMTNAAGVTCVSPFDSITGLHHLQLDLSDNDDAGFWATGSDYTVVLNPSDETVDSQTVVAVLATFSIENRTNTLLATAASITALNDLTAAQVNAECDTAISDASLATAASVSALNDLSAAQVNAECDTAISDANLALEATLTDLKGGGYNNTTDTMEDIRDAISAVGGLSGAGAEEHEMTIDDGSNPIDGAEVWVSTDLAGTNVVAGTLTTDASGNVTFMLDAGSYYAWVQKAGYNFSNPTSFTVTA